MTQDEAYIIASYVDGRIEDLLTQYPINRKTYRGWRTLIRTVRTSLNILDLVVNTYDCAMKPPQK